MISYYEADCVYNPKYGKNTCSICKYINECTLILPKDKEYKYLKGKVDYYYRLRKELQHDKKIKKRKLYEFDEEKEQKKYQKKKEFYDKIIATEPVYFNDGKYILINIPKTNYIFFATSIKETTAMPIRYKKEHKNLKELKEDINAYDVLKKEIENFNVKQTDLILKKLLENLNTKKTIHPSKIDEKLVYWSLIKYLPISPEKYKKRLKKNIKNLEKSIEEYDQELRNFQMKKFKRDKILRKRIKKDIEKGLIK